MSHERENVGPLGHWSWSLLELQRELVLVQVLMTDFRHFLLEIGYYVPSLGPGLDLDHSPGCEPECVEHAEYDAWSWVEDSHTAVEADPDPDQDMVAVAAAADAVADNDDPDAAGQKR